MARVSLQRSRLPLLTCAFGLFAAWLLLLSGCGPTRPARSLAAAGPAADARWLGPGQVPVPYLRGPALVVDGDLADWSGLPLTYLDPRWDQTYGDYDPEPHPDRAAIRLARDDAALYVAARVIDEEVVNPYTGPALWQGDCLELFLDLRPAGAAGDPAVLGADRYTAGCYQLVFAPVAPDGQARPRWVCLQSDPGAPRSLAVASRIETDGYTLEIRIPFAQLNASPASRFAAPFGVDFGVEDVQRTAPGQVQYLWRGRQGSYASAAHFGRAVPVTGSVGNGPLVRYLAPRYALRDGAHRFTVAAVFRNGAEPADLWLDVRYQGTPADLPAEPTASGGAAEESGSFAAVEDSSTAWQDSLLGIQVVEREVRLTGLPGGRYWLVCQVPDGGVLRADTVRAYYESRRDPGALLLGDPATENGTEPGLMARRLRLVADRYHSFGNDTVHVELLSSLSGSQRWALAEQADRDLARVVLELWPAAADSGPPVWSDSVRLTGQPRGILIPSSLLPPGPYLARVAVHDSTGGRWAVTAAPADSVPAALLLGLHPGPAPVLAARLDTSQIRFARAVQVADPNRRRFPLDDAHDCHARSLWDLQTYEGRLYAGAGGPGLDQGPVDLWSMAPASPRGKVVVVHEQTVDEEAADLFVPVDGNLAVPDTEPEIPGDAGALYLREQGQWRRLTTLPGDGHLADLARLDGSLYATAGDSLGGGLYRSTDHGQTWSRLAPRGFVGLTDGRYGELARVAGGLLVAHHLAAQHLLFADGSGLRRLAASLFTGVGPTTSALMPWRLTEAQGGVYYTFKDWGGDSGPRPLFFLRDPSAGGALVEPFAAARVQDLVARGDTVLVLTAEPAGEEFSGAVYRSIRPETWTRVAVFRTPALARSLEELDGALYVGLACYPGEIRPASGRVCRLEAPQRPTPRKALKKKPPKKARRR